LLLFTIQYYEQSSFLTFWGELIAQSSAVPVIM